MSFISVFSASLLQSSVSHDPSEIILMFIWSVTSLKSLALNEIKLLLLSCQRNAVVHKCDSEGVSIQQTNLKREREWASEKEKARSDANKQHDCRVLSGRSKALWVANSSNNRLKSLLLEEWERERDVGRESSCVVMHTNREMII